jgi:hypothetical protein
MGDRLPGFYYKAWKGLFYPQSLPQKECFKFYAQHFNTLELNVTFYRFPVLRSLENWNILTVLISFIFYLAPFAKEGPALCFAAILFNDRQVAAKTGFFSVCKPMLF